MNQLNFHHEIKKRKMSSLNWILVVFDRHSLNQDDSNFFLNFEKLVNNKT